MNESASAKIVVREKDRCLCRLAWQAESSPSLSLIILCLQSWNHDVHSSRRLSLRIFDDVLCAHGSYQKENIFCFLPRPCRPFIFCISFEFSLFAEVKCCSVLCCPGNDRGDTLEMANVIPIQNILYAKHMYFAFFGWINVVSSMPVCFWVIATMCYCLPSNRRTHAWYLISNVCDFLFSLMLFSSSKCST